MTRHKRTTTALIGVGLVLSMLFGFGQPAPAASTTTAAHAAKTLASCAPASAHRGQSLDRPENTRPAIQAALDAGVRWIEGDVQWNKSNVPHIIHDADVYRTSNSTVHQNVLDMWWADVAALDFGYPKKFGTAFAGTKIMTLWDWLDLLRSNNAQGLLEIKPAAPTATHYAEMWSRIDQTGMQDRLIIMSFSPSVVAAVRSQRPGVRTMLLESPNQADTIRRLTSVQKYGGYAPDERYFDDAELRYWAEPGLPLVPWTTDDPARWASLNAAAPGKLTAITTNNSVAYQQWMTTACPAAEPTTEPTPPPTPPVTDGPSPTPTPGS